MTPQIISVFWQDRLVDLLEGDLDTVRRYKVRLHGGAYKNKIVSRRTTGRRLIGYLWTVLRARMDKRGSGGLMETSIDIISPCKPVLKKSAKRPLVTRWIIRKDGIRQRYHVQAKRRK